MALRARRAQLATIHSLPDALLSRCLRLVDQGERLRWVCAVSRRFRDLCCDPELLRDLQVHISSERVVERARSLLQFLLSHARHLRRLDLTIKEDSAQLDGAGVADMQLSVVMCLAVCGATGTLEELLISEDTPLRSLAWLPGLRRLRKLQLGSEVHALRLPDGLSRLTSLKEASVAGSCLLGLVGGDPPTLQLPSSLTKLSLTHAYIDGLPEQITALRNLEALELGSTCDPASLQALTSLSGLRRLSLEGLVWMPGCLAHMPQLQQLELHCIADVEDDELQVLHLGLHALQQLTSLALDFRYCTRVPAAVAGLQRPQRCTLYMNPRAEDALPAPERRLAGGPWLGSLRWLGLCWAAALENIDVLAAAQRLEYLCLLDALDAKVMIADPAFPCRFWDWAATHQPLRCLAFEHTADDGPAPLHMFDAVLDLAVRRPGLLVRRTGRGDACCFCEEMLQLDGIPAA